MLSPQLSIVIPVRNEIVLLGEMLEHYRDLASCPAQVELLFVDGESRDGSHEYLQDRGFRVLSSTPGRARQMNAGAAAAKGKMLLFLHADTVLPEAAIPALFNIARSSTLWGRFDVIVEGTGVMFRIIGAMMNLRSRLSGVATGDMGMFVRRELFLQLGGFPDLPLMEDIALSKILRRQARPYCLKPPLTTSGRRWQQRGIWRTIFLMWRLRFYYFIGVSPARLAEWYR